jgi:hypothetical protein
MDTTEKAVVEVTLEVIRKAKEEWTRVFGPVYSQQGTRTVARGLSDALGGLSLLTEPIYFPWSWALQRVREGHKVTWKDWRQCYIVRDGNFIRRESLVDGKVVRVSNFEPSIDKFTTEGWTTWEE